MMISTHLADDSAVALDDAQRWAIAPFTGERAQADPQRAAQRLARVCRWRFPEYGGSCEIVELDADAPAQVMRWTPLRGGGGSAEVPSQRSVSIDYAGAHYGRLSLAAVPPQTPSAEAMEFLRDAAAAMGLLMARHRADVLAIRRRGRRVVLGRRAVHRINNHLNTLAMQLEVAKLLAEREGAQECLEFLRGAEQECRVLVETWTDSCGVAVPPPAK